MFLRLIRPNGALAHASKQVLVRQPYRCLSYTSTLNSSNLQRISSLNLSKQSNSINFLSDQFQSRQLHTSNNRRDEKENKDDKKKSDKEPKEEGPIHLSAAVLGALVVFALGVAPFILEYTQEAAFPSVTFREFTDMARNNKIRSITHSESTRTLFLETSEGKKKLPGLDYNMAVTRLEQIYDAMSLHPADRIMITREQGSAPGDVARKFWDVLISPTTLMIFFFSLMWFPNFRNRIMQGMKLNMNQTAAQDTAKAIKGKGKKRSQRNQEERGRRYVRHDESTTRDHEQTGGRNHRTK